MAGLGAAPKWRLGLALKHFAQELTEKGSRLILRRGAALDVLRALVVETGARSVLWTRGLRARPDCSGHSGESGAEGRWARGAKAIPVICCSNHGTWPPRMAGSTRSIRQCGVPCATAKCLRLCPRPPALLRQMSGPPATGWTIGRWAAPWIAARMWWPNTSMWAKRPRMGGWARFWRIASRATKSDRDRLDMDACSGLSENLTYGEISPRTIWHAGWRALQDGQAQAEDFLKELVWREFAYHLIYHTPRLESENWRPDWDGFPWQGEGDAVQAWRQGRTGIEVVDAAMRELYVTGRMHNRARMLVASFLTKHLLVDWRLGRDWFADCLVDWDPAANAMGWQWVAGSGPDAAPYFRIFNPDTQAQKFDPNAGYRKMWLAEASRTPPQNRA